MGGATRASAGSSSDDGFRCAQPILQARADWQRHRDIAGSALAIVDDFGHASEKEDPARTVTVMKQFVWLS
jgi:hypothetical protein